MGIIKKKLNIKFKEKMEETILNQDSIDRAITAEVVKFEPHEARIATMREEFFKLKIKGLEDKDGYNEVYEARQFARKRRVEIDNMRRDMKAGALRFGRAVEEKAQALIKDIIPIEDYLQGQIDEILEAKAKIKEEQERKQRERTRARALILMSMNMVFDGDEYALNDEAFRIAYEDYLPVVAIKNNEVEQIDDTTFDMFIGEAKERFAMIKVFEQRLAELAPYENFMRGVNFNLAKIDENKYSEALATVKALHDNYVQAQEKKAQEAADRLKRDNERWFKIAGLIRYAKEAYLMHEIYDMDDAEFYALVIECEKERAELEALKKAREDKEREEQAKIIETQVNEIEIVPAGNSEPLGEQGEIKLEEQPVIENRLPQDYHEIKAFVANLRALKIPYLSNRARSKDVEKVRAAVNGYIKNYENYI